MKCPWRGVLLLAMYGCGGSDGTAPGPDPAAPPDLSAYAFQLRIDAHSGTIEIGRPAAATRSAPVADGRSFSLIGADALTLAVPEGCTFSAIPNRPKFKRCSFPIQIENRLKATDLVTPTVFPRPPAGANGILVFPWTAAARGGRDTTVSASPDWDRGPANFFNDFKVCTTAPMGDCYRYEVFGSPLYADDESDSRTVGFDIPGDATSVEASLIVAADLRDNPVQGFRVVLEPTRSGMIGIGSDGSAVYPGGLGDPLIGDQLLLEIGTSEVIPGGYDYVYRVFMSFVNVLPDRPVRIVSADLQVFPLVDGGRILAESVDFGSTFDETIYDQSTLGLAREMNYSSQDDRLHAQLVSELQEQADRGVDYFQFRLRGKTQGVYSRLWGPMGGGPRPSLTVAYTLR